MISLNVRFKLRKEVFKHLFWSPCTCFTCNVLLLSTWPHSMSKTLAETYLGWFKGKRLEGISHIIITNISWNLHLRHKPARIYSLCATSLRFRCNATTAHCHGTILNRHYRCSPSSRIANRPWNRATQTFPTVPIRPIFAHQLPAAVEIGRRTTSTWTYLRCL